MFHRLLRQMPFQGLTLGQVYSRIVHDGAHPPLDAFNAAKEQSVDERPALEAYTGLLQRCWSAEAPLRPRFKQVHTLRVIEHAARSPKGS